MANEEACHFTWNLEQNVEDTFYRNKIKHLKKEIDMDPDIKARGLITLAYFYAIQENPQLDESLKCLDEALAICDQLRYDHPENEGYKIVALRNRAHVLKLAGMKEDDTEEIIREIDSMKPFSSNASAGIHGLKGFTMILFSDKETQEIGYRSYQDAVELDPENFEWYLGMGILAKRLRILREGEKTEPSKMEEDHLSKAVQLSEKKKALPLALLADIPFFRSRDKSMSGFRDEAKKLYKMAYEVAPSNIHVLKRCGKAFPVMGEIDLAEECLKKALELDPEDVVILHRLGNIYWKSKPPKRDYEKAEKYILRAISGKDRSFYADIDLVIVRQLMNKGYDAIQHLEDIKKYYDDRPEYLSRLDEVIKKVKMNFGKICFLFL